MIDFPWMEECMLYSLPLRIYLMQMKAYSNDPVTLDKLLEPFRISTGEKQDHHFLLVGYILDDLADQKKLTDAIDPLDVASSAWELGYEPAKKFLEQAPFLIYNLIKEDYMDKYLIKGLL